MTKRVAVFIDYQNVYRRARDAFGLRQAAHWQGQVHPQKVGDLIAARVKDGALEYVRIYRGLPDAAKDPKGNAACTRQVDAWRKQARVRVFTRPLRYPPAYPAEKATEKGIDVQLAIDFVTEALDGRFDVGVIFSADTDLKPALETVVARTQIKVEVATWQPPSGYASRIAIPGRSIWCHYLDASAFASVADPIDYT